ncbi:class II aldolase/adducin family protein [Thalassospira marina]|uniref:Class II aldolase n=1 Tax=Thalassospira marina TaxID=2048283 RepID=A0ABN5FQC3_9PROT|nr:class II aldolase/adducin family protein [Thalassospira marina]AUG55746.1 class II aldolase [Thalassospira marina]
MLNTSIKKFGSHHSVKQPGGSVETEVSLRIQLAEFYHLVAYLGWTEAIFNHISLRLPGTDSHYLVNPFGLHYEEVTPENLVTVDLAGNLVGPSQYPANPAGFALHGAIHEVRHDMHCIAHTHTTAVSAIALKQDGFQHDDFYGAQLFEQVAYHDFEGVTLFADEKPRILKSLGDKNVLVMRNHGIAVGGRDVPRTFWTLFTAQRAAEIQCQAGMLPGRNSILSDQVRQRCSKVADDLAANASFAQKMFDGMVRKMRRHTGPLWPGDNGIDRLH